MARLLTGLIIGLALGALITTVVHDSRDDEESPVVVYRDVESKDGTQQRTPLTSTEGPRRAAPVTLRSLLDALPDLPVARGKRSVAGNVLSVSGDPIPEATVYAYPPMPETRNPYDRSIDIEERIRLIYQRERWFEDQQRTTKVNADGTFKLEGLTSGKWRFTAKAEGWEFPHGQDGAGFIEIRGKPVVELSVDVRYRDGTRLDKALIIVETGPRRSTRREWSARDRMIRVPKSTTALRAELSRAQEALSWKSDRVLVDLKDANAERPVTLTVTSQPLIHGRVDRSQRRGARGQVYAFRNRPQTKEEWQQRHFGRGKNSFDTHPRADGSYRIEGLSEGAWHVIYMVGNHKASDWQLVDVAGATRCDLVALPIDEAQFLRVHVIDAEGNALTDGLNFFAKILSANGGFSGSSLNAELDGESWLVRRPQADHEDARCEFEVTSSQGTVVRDFALPREAPLTLKFLPSARLKIQLVGPAASLERVSVQVAAGRRKIPLEHQSKGRWITKDRIQPGTYEVSYGLSANPSYFAESIGPTKTIQVNAGEQDCVLQVPRICRLEVRVPGYSDGSVELVSVEGHQKSARLSEEMASFLAFAGNYEVFCSRANRAAGQSITLSDDQTVTLTLAAPNALRVLRLHRDGSCQRAGLLKGDLVISVDGISLSNDGELRKAAIKFRRQASLSVTVLRGGQPRDFRIERRPEERGFTSFENARHE